MQGELCYTGFYLKLAYFPLVYLLQACGCLLEGLRYKLLIS